MIWVIITAGTVGLGAAVTIASMALWCRRLRALKEMLAASRLFRDKPDVGSDTGFLIFSEMLAAWSVRVFSVGYVVACVGSIVDPARSRAALLTFFSSMFLGGLHSYQ